MPVNEHLFISDVHLGAFPDEKESAIRSELLSLIQYATEHHAVLYVLGDLFDYWMEYPDHQFIPPIGKEVLDAFEEYNREVAPTLFITGNHDNWTHKHFTERGFDVEAEYRIIEIGNSKILLMHGDGYPAAGDHFHRPLLHRILRNPSFIDLYQRLLPPEKGLGLMKRFSNLTRKRNYISPKQLNKRAEILLKSMNIDLVMCGHDHIPRTETFDKGTYINLGTFFKHKTLVRYINDAFTLVIWHAETKEFVPYGRQ